MDRPCSVPDTLRSSVILDDQSATGVVLSYSINGESTDNDTHTRTHARMHTHQEGKEAVRAVLQHGEGRDVDPTIPCGGLQAVNRRE